MTCGIHMTMSQSLVLLIEPDVLVREPLARYLRECGFVVIAVADAREGRAFLDSDVQPDVILLAVTDSGEELTFAGWVRQHFPNIRLVLAGSVGAKVQQAGRLCEDEAPISRPYDHQLVEQRIRRMLAARAQD